jgi:hypothetical protein
MAMKVPSDAKFGFLVAVGVLAALAAWAMVAKRVPALAG